MSQFHSIWRLLHTIKLLNQPLLVNVQQALDHRYVEMVFGCSFMLQQTIVLRNRLMEGAICIDMWQLVTRPADYLFLTLQPLGNRRDRRRLSLLAVAHILLVAIATMEAQSLCDAVGRTAGIRLTKDRAIPADVSLLQVSWCGHCDSEQEQGDEVSFQHVWIMSREASSRDFFC